jgi:hypothetical protein
MVLQTNQNLWIFVFLRMYSPCEVNAKERLLILGQLWGRKTKFDPNANSYKYLIFYKIGLSPYL